MNIYSKISVVALIVVITISLGFLRPTVSSAATDPGLGAAATFSIVAQTSITGTGTIAGNVGINSTGAGITALTAGDVGGTIYSTNGVAPGLAILDPAVQANLSTANDNITAQAPTASIGPALDGLVLTAGVYDIGAGRLNGGVLTLNGPGVYIFRASSDFVSSGSINLTNGARACDVYWQVSTLAAINGSEFTGTIIAGTGIHFGANVTLDGRALALGGDVTLINTTISGPACTAVVATGTLHIVKHVVNDNGGTATASDFTINVAGTSVSTPSFAGSEAGIDVTVGVGDYAVTEVSLAGYLGSGSGDCTGSILANETKNCTITNNDIAPQLTVSKVVINDSGRDLQIADFPLLLDGISVTSGIATATTVGSHTVSEDVNSNYAQTFSGDCNSSGIVNLALGDIKFCIITNNDNPIASGGGGGSASPTPPPLITVVKVPNPLALPDGPGRVTYTYTLRNAGIIPVTNITMVGDTCSPIILTAGDINNDSILATNEIWTYTCSTTLTETHTNTVVATGWGNGISTVDSASATVVVGLPLVPPLINVVKVPSPLILNFGGGSVTYTATVTNPGTVPLNNVGLTDDKCGTIHFISGDLNSNSMLDSGESWVYTCRSYVNKTTLNTATATGTANGLTVRDIAVATVVVSALVPGLPNTGFASEHVSLLITLLILLVVSLMVIFWPQRTSSRKR